MAGGPHAELFPCLQCFTRAERTLEGMENDYYRCAAGHTFGVDWSCDGPPQVAQWPPSEQAREAFERLRRARGA